MEPDLDPVQPIGADQRVLFRDDRGRLNLHGRLAVLERAAVRQRSALRFDLHDEETGAAVRMARGQGICISAMRGTQGIDVRLQAARHLPRRARYGQVVLDAPDCFDRDEVPVLGAIARLALRVIDQLEPAPRIDASQAAHAAHALRGGFPLFNADARQPVALGLLAERIGAGVFVHLRRPRQGALPGGRDARALGPGRRGRLLVVESARGQLRAMEFAGLFPVREAIAFFAHTAAAERHSGRAGCRQGVHAVHDHHRVRLAILRLLEIKEQPFLFHQPVHEIPVVLELLDERADRQRVAQHETERTLGALMPVEHIGKNLFDGLVLPVARVMAIVQKMQPRRHGELYRMHAAVRADFVHGVDITVMRRVGVVGLLYPERDGLRHQVARLEGIQHVNRIDLEIVVASDASASMDPLRQELIRAQRRVQLDQPAGLEHARADGVDDFRDVRAHVHIRKNPDCMKIWNLNVTDYFKAIESRFVNK